MVNLDTQNGLDITNARRRASINVDSVRNYLHGEAEWEARKAIVNVLEKDPAFDKAQRPFLSRTEQFHRGLRMIKRLADLEDTHKWNVAQRNLARVILDEPLPIELHAVAFEPVFNLQGSEDLVAKYGPLIESRGILGCYLQTELGHGTNVARLETTATFIPETQEFDIHSPTRTSAKWWIGALGKMSTHGVVQAKLILPDGTDMGPHLFFMQLRSLIDHKVLPGIEIGDIGPKVMSAWGAVDNGYARFNHVRIPKEQMLSKFARVTDDGKYIQPPHAKLSYGGMLYIRSSMVTSAGWHIAKAATIAIRYTTVRRQGSPDANGLDTQVISYPSTYYRLLPVLSHAYVYIQLGKQLVKSFNEMSARLATGDASLLPDLHAMTSGLKACVTAVGVNDIETCRRAMGGHGFGAFSGMGQLYADYLPNVTFEGDNFALDQQVVRAAVKSYKLLSSGKAKKSSEDSVNAYLRLLVNSSTPTKVASWADSSLLVLLLEWRAALVVRDHAENLNQAACDANRRVSKAVTEAFVARHVSELISQLPETLGEKDRPAVGHLYHLFLLTTLEASIDDFLTFNLLTGADVRPLRIEIKRVCEQLLPNAIGLTDAFGFTDWELDSALGKYDGRVYDALIKKAELEPLNKEEVTSAYEESLKPMMIAGREKAKMKAKL